MRPESLNHRRIISAVCTNVMGRRPRNHQSSGYGLTTILVAGLAFVDSFNLVVRSPQQSRLQSNPGLCPRQQRHVRTASPRNKCPATPRSSIPDGSPPPRKTPERKVGTSQQSTPVVATRTGASASKVAVTELSTATAAAAAAASGIGNNSRGNGGRGESGRAASEGGDRAAGRRSKALQEKQQLQRSIRGLDDRAMSRGQLVSSFAMVGAAAALLGGSGVASAKTEVSWGERGEVKDSTCRTLYPFQSKAQSLQ